MKQTSSSGTTRNVRPTGRTAKVVKLPKAENPESDWLFGPRPVPADADAQRALAWLARGPQAEIVPDDAVPPQSKADLAKFRPASIKRSKKA